MTRQTRRRDVTRPEAIKLWTRAHGTCSFPGCRRELVWGEDDDTRLRGHMAHIAASSPDGTRGESGAESAALDRYENLILLCPNHHEEIDSDGERYSVAGLQDMKQKHEAWIARQLQKGAVWQAELATIDYLNVPRLLLDPAAQEVDVNLASAMKALNTGTLRDLGFGLNYVTLAFEEVFRSWHAQALPLDAVTELGEDAIGSRIAFSGTFWTKNMTGADVQSPEYRLSGDPEKDPHIHLKLEQRKLFLPLDPRWVTTSTAFADFTAGRGRFAGIGTLKSVTEERAIISPLAVGHPPLAPGVKAIFDSLQRPT
jgi:hypothetical protein